MNTYSPIQLCPCCYLSVPYEGEFERAWGGYFANPDDDEFAPFFYKQLSVMKSFATHGYYGVWRWRVIEEHAERTFSMNPEWGYRSPSEKDYWGDCLIVTLNLHKKICSIELVEARADQVIKEYPEHHRAFRLESGEAQGIRDFLQYCVSSMLMTRAWMEEL
jgi:hypothetical protein